MSLRRLGLIALLTLALAAYSAWLRSVRPASAERDRDDVPMVGGIRLYRLAEVRALSGEESTRLLDVRSAGDYAGGHLPGALNLPEDDFDALFPALRSRLEQARTILVYCDSKECARALRVAIRLRTAGFAQVQIYPGGWNEWANHRMPVERTANP